MNFSDMQGDIIGDIVILNEAKKGISHHFLLSFCNEVLRDVTPATTNEGVGSTS